MEQRLWTKTPWGADYIIQDGDRGFLRRSQDMDTVQKILDANAACRNNGRNGYTESRDMRRVASIPIVFYHELVKRYGDDCLTDGKKLSMILKEYPYLKTVDGRV